jgi:hypothetical protein
LGPLGPLGPTGCEQARLQMGQEFAGGSGELGVEVGAVLGLEDLGAHGQQAGACLGPVQDGGQLGPDAGGRFASSAYRYRVAAS